MQKISLLRFLLSIIILFLPQGKVCAWFQTGQDAYILLSGIDFNNAGYLNTPGDGLLFNHPGNIATDGIRLLLADRNNNRVLIWKSLPETNTSPDLVLGQENFITNDPGSGLNQMNWPVSVSAAENKVVVADTYNNRILVWTTFPEVNGQSADFCIQFDDLHKPLNERLEWPWAVWTDGTKLIATSTVGSTVFIWNTFPESENDLPDFSLSAINLTEGESHFGTPRTIGTDGSSYLEIGDHNPQNESAVTGNFFWNSFPTEDVPYDFFMPNPYDPYQLMWGGVKTSEGKFITLSSMLYIWNSVPREEKIPDLSITAYTFEDGDGSGMAVTPSDKLYISLSNGNKIVGYHSVPKTAEQIPDFALGAPDIDTNTLETKSIITNPVPATDGTSLIVTSDFDRKLYVWKTIPSVSGTPPDLVYSLEQDFYQPWDNALNGNTFVAAGEKTVQIWTSLPVTENSLSPAYTFKDKIGTQNLQSIKGVALDDNYLYLADEQANQVYVFKALPDANTSPLFSLSLPFPSRLSSDGDYLVVVSMPNSSIYIYRVNGLSASSLPVAEISPLQYPQESPLSKINLPQDALVKDNHLFIADTNRGRVLSWESIEDAIKGKDPDVVLGQPDFSSINQAIGVNRLFWPAGLAFYRNKLWVGEFKFSCRLVGFTYAMEGCKTWDDVIAEYNNYVNGSGSWDEVISTYNEYVKNPC